MVRWHRSPSLGQILNKLNFFRYDGIITGTLYLKGDANLYPMADFHLAAGGTLIWNGAIMN
jgi:hypothetical protein